MSYDLEIWSVREPADTPTDCTLTWLTSAAGWTSSSRKWQFVIDRPCRVEPEDVSDEIARSLPGIQFLTRFYLEGKVYSRFVSKARSLAKSIARSAHGIVVDPQEDVLILPSGIKRIDTVRRDERYTSLTLTWWFLDESALASDGGPEMLLNLIERRLPELLPSRYGMYGPLEFKYNERGREHFLEFLRGGLRDGPIWKPGKPFDIHLDFPKPVGASWQSFRTNRIEVSVDAALLSQPGWQDQLRLFWIDRSSLIQPIYGDVRKLKGQPRSGCIQPMIPTLRNIPYDHGSGGASRQGSARQWSWAKRTKAFGQTS